MSTDHHLEDNADDQVRAAVAAAPPTPAHIRSRHRDQSAITAPGVVAGRDLPAGEPLLDLVGPQPDPVDMHALDRREQVVRFTGAPIPEGSAMEVRADGLVYPVDQDALELAEDLVDVAAGAAAAEEVDHALDAAAPDPGAAIAAGYDFAEAIAGMANRHLQENGLALEVVEACTGCGCTNNRACVTSTPVPIFTETPMVETCHWTHQPGQPPLCSSCAAGEHHEQARLVDERARRR